MDKRKGPETIEGELFLEHVFKCEGQLCLVS